MLLEDLLAILETLFELLVVIELLVAMSVEGLPASG